MSTKTGTWSSGAAMRSRCDGAASVLATSKLRRWCYRRSGRATRKSLGLGAGKLDHFGPLVGFGFDEIAELRDRQRHRRAAEIDQPVLELSISERRIDLFVQSVDDRRRRSFGRADPQPRRCLVAWQIFTERRKIG